MPRFMGFVRMEEGVGTPPQALFDAMDEYISERAAKGVFLDGGGLYGTEDAVNYIVRQGEVTRVDGPYAEAKEVVGGYWIIQARSKEEAVEWAKRCPGVDCRVEVRPIWELEDFSPEIKEALKVYDEDLHPGV